MPPRRPLHAALLLALAACGTPRPASRAPARAQPAATALPPCAHGVIADPEGSRTPGKGSAVNIQLAMGGGGWQPGLDASERDLAGTLDFMHQLVHASRGQKGAIDTDVRAEEAAVAAETDEAVREARQKSGLAAPRRSRPEPFAGPYAPGWDPLDYAKVNSGAARGGRHGALSHCVDGWRHAAHLRQRVYAELAAHPPAPDARVVLLEAASFPDPLYGYVLVVGGERVLGLLGPGPRRAPAPELHALAGAALDGASRGDETAADRITDGHCYFVTVREGPREAQFGWFAPTLAPDPRGPERLLQALTPILEGAWAGPE